MSDETPEPEHRRAVFVVGWDPGGLDDDTICEILRRSMSEAFAKLLASGARNPYMNVSLRDDTDEEPLLSAAWRD